MALLLVGTEMLTGYILHLCRPYALALTRKPVAQPACRAVGQQHSGPRARAPLPRLPSLRLL